MSNEQHYPDGRRWHDSSSFEGLVFECGCGERFMEYGELLAHIEEHAKEAA